MSTDIQRAHARWQREQERKRWRKHMDTVNRESKRRWCRDNGVRFQTVPNDPRYSAKVHHAMEHWYRTQKGRDLLRRALLAMKHGETMLLTSKQGEHVVVPYAALSDFLQIKSQTMRVTVLDEFSDIDWSKVEMKLLTTAAKLDAEAIGSADHEARQHGIRTGRLSHKAPNAG